MFRNEKKGERGGRREEGNKTAVWEHEGDLEPRGTHPLPTSESRAAGKSFGTILGLVPSRGGVSFPSFLVGSSRCLWGTLTGAHRAYGIVCTHGGRSYSQVGTSPRG